MNKSIIVLSGLSLMAMATGSAGFSHSHQAAPAAGRPAAAPAVSAWWRPGGAGPNDGAEFQWEIDHPLNVSNATDMGSPAVHTPAIFDIDGIENPASTVTALHAQGDKAICYIEVGSAGNYYAASDEGIPVTYYAQLKAAGDRGRKMSGYPEYYLNINAASTVTIIESMIREQCAAKGFDAVEPDIDDSYTDRTGFTVTEADNIAYDKKLGAYAHSLGLAWGQKNGDNDAAFSAALAPTTDFLLTEECRYYDTCSIVTPPYLKAGKLVLDSEYTDDWGSNAVTDRGKFCAADVAAGIDGTLFKSSLAGYRSPCNLAHRPGIPHAVPLGHSAATVAFSLDQ
jgi:hypothetical protein